VSGFPYLPKRARSSPYGSSLMEIDEKWCSGRKYLDMKEYLQWRIVSEKSHSKVTLSIAPGQSASLLRLV
jgi:hypothetical protein